MRRRAVGAGGLRVRRDGRRWPASVLSRRHVRSRKVRLVRTEAPSAGGLAAAVREHDGEIRNDNCTDGRDSGKPARMVHVRHDGDNEAKSADTHHDQVPPLAIGDVLRLGRPRLGHHLRALAALRPGQASGVPPGPWEPRLSWVLDFSHYPTVTGPPNPLLAPSPPTSAGGRPMIPATCARAGAPARAIACARASVRPVSSSVTPSAPPQASAQSTGRPTNTAPAPRATAASTSSPVRMPPSTQAGTSPGVPARADATPGRAQAAGMAPSSWRPP